MKNLLFALCLLAASFCARAADAYIYSPVLTNMSSMFISQTPSANNRVTTLLGGISATNGAGGGMFDFVPSSSTATNSTSVFRSTYWDGVTAQTTTGRWHRVSMPAEGGLAITNHNALLAIQGGTPAEYYHLTSAEYTGTGTGVFVRKDSPTITTSEIISGTSLGLQTESGFNEVFYVPYATTVTQAEIVRHVDGGSYATGRLEFYTGFYDQTVQTLANAETNSNMTLALSLTGGNVIVGGTTSSAKFRVTGGGSHFGGTSDPGANNISVDGTAFMVAGALGSQVTTNSALFQNVTASRAAMFDSLKNLTNSVTTATELSYVNGVTSDIQTQLNSKVTGSAANLSVGAGVSITSGTGTGATLQALTLAVNQAFTPTWTGRHTFTTTGDSKGIVLNPSLAATFGTTDRALEITPAFNGETDLLTFGYGIYLRPTTVANLSVGAIYGVNIWGPTLGSGSTADTVYGLRVENISQGSDNYSLWTGTAKNYFGGATAAAGIISAPTLAITNAASMGSLAVGTNATVGGTLVVTGNVNGGTLSGNNTGDQTITLTGPVTGSGTGSFATTITNSIAAGGPTGSATVAPILTYNANGMLTAVSSATITPAATNVTGGAALTKVDDSNVTLTLGGSPTTALLAGTSLTLGWTGNLSVPRGGSGVGTISGIMYANGTSPFTAGNGTAGTIAKFSSSSPGVADSIMTEAASVVSVGGKIRTSGTFTASQSFSAEGTTTASGTVQRSFSAQGSQASAANGDVLVALDIGQTLINPSAHTSLEGYGVRVYNPGGTGTIPTYSGLWIDSLTRGSTSYGIYDSTALNYIEGLHIGGTSAPGANNLIVDGGTSVGTSTVTSGVVNVATGFRIGDVAGSGTFLKGDGTNFIQGSIVATNLPATAVTPGSYTLASITVDQQGRLTAASSGSAASGTVTSVGMTVPSFLSVSGSPVTTSGTLAVTMTGLGWPNVNWTSAETVTITNSTTEATLLGTGLGSKTIAANILKAGSVVRYHMMARSFGSMTTNATLQLRVKGIGTDFNLGAFALEMSGYNIISLHGEINIQGVGASAGYSHSVTLINNITPIECGHVGLSSTVDTTVSHTFDITAQMDTAGGNSIGSISCTLETLNTNQQ